MVDVNPRRIQTEARDVPILFSAPMVRAILRGDKTQTRRALKPQPRWSYVWQDEGNGQWISRGPGEAGDDPIHIRWEVGNRLWVREAWSGLHAFRDTKPSERESFVGDGVPFLREDIWYWADGAPTGGDYEKPRPSIHMPRWASRITLLVEAVRVERLQDISEEDAVAEGCGRSPRGDWWTADDSDPALAACSARGAFYCLWSKINGPGAWHTNPWVSVTTFRRLPSNPTQQGDRIDVG